MTTETPELLRARQLLISGLPTEPPSLGQSFMLMLMMLLMLLATQVGSICIVEHFRRIV